MTDGASLPEEGDTRAEVLAEEVRRLRALAELSGDWFWEQDAEFRFTRFFGNSPEKLNRQPSDFIGKRRWEMAIGGVSPARMAEHIAVCKRHEPFRDFVYEILSAQGAPQYLSISGAPLFDAAGAFIGYLGTGRNITELRHAEQRIADSERRLAQIVDSSPVPMFVIDGAHRVTHWNQACERLTGVSAAMVRGTTDAWRGFYAAPRPTMADLIVEEAAELKVAFYYGDKYNRSRLIPGTFEAEDFFAQMSGGGRWLYFTAAPLHDARGRISGAIETLQDVSPRKLAERTEQEHWVQLQEAHAELQQAMKQLVEAEKLASLGRLVAGISHELNTPLGNAMVVATSLLEMIDELAAHAQSGGIRRSELERLFVAGKESGAILVSSIDRANRLLRRFREIAAEPSGDRPQAFQLSRLVAGVISSMAGALKEANVTIAGDIADDLLIESYPGALEQILCGLIDNSLLHGFAGRTEGCITISSAAAAGEVVIHYADNGAGMTPEVRRHAFDPFFTTRLGRGESGLGLYLAHNLATATLGGRIELLPATEAGTAFRITLAQRQSTRSP